MNDLSETFKKRLNQLGIKKQVDAAMVCEEFDAAVLEVFGEMGKKNVKAISYKNNCLKVGVSSSSWASEINLRRLDLANGLELSLKFELTGCKKSELF